MGGSKHYSVSTPKAVAALKSPRMETIHSLLDLVFISWVFSSLLLASSLASWGHVK